MLEKEFQYFINNQKELVEKYPGKFIVIKDEDVIGVFDDEVEAYREGQKLTPLGTFLIQECKEGGAEAYTQIFHSRVIFA